MIDQNLIRKLFVYEPDTGRLRRIGGRKPYPWRGIGKDRKYLSFTYRGETIYLHRAVWLYHHGYVPNMLDHIDRDTRNCRLENLRPCTPAQNQYNSKKKIHNKAGYKGVVFHRACLSKPWQAKIVVDKRVVSLGYYATPEEAANAYKVGANRYAKEFARHA